MKSARPNRSMKMKDLDGYYPHSWGKSQYDYSSTTECTIEDLDRHQYDWIKVHRDIEIDGEITTSNRITIRDPYFIRIIIMREEALAKHIRAAKESMRSISRY